MTYLKIDWIHDFSDEPIALYSELDEFRNEIRKVELFRDGVMGYADRHTEIGGSVLSAEPIPETGKIAHDPQFSPTSIDSDEFEKVWRAANGQRSSTQ
jgi:hypothetical protein